MDMDTVVVDIVIDLDVCIDVNMKCMEVDKQQLDQEEQLLHTCKEDNAEGKVCSH